MVDHIGGFSHEAFLYASLPEFLDEVCGFLREGIERDEAVLVATGGERLAALRTLFDGEPDVQIVDMAEVGANPARIIPVWRDFLAKNVAAGRAGPRARRADLGRPQRGRAGRVPPARVAAQPGVRGRPGLAAALPVRRHRAAGRGHRGGAGQPPAGPGRRDLVVQRPLPRRSGRTGRCGTGRCRRRASRRSSWRSAPASWPRSAGWSRAPVPSTTCRPPRPRTWCCASTRSRRTA